MANFVVETNLRHLLERAQKRFGMDKERARDLILKVRQIVREKAPDDWRFTVSPTAKFIISLEPEKNDFRLLGRTYRDHKDEGKKIVNELKIRKNITRNDLDRLAERYRKLIFCPDCEIFHEIKTIYTCSQDLSEEKEFFEKISTSLSHIVPMKGKRIALRPNAIVADGEIWVRQGEYFNLSKETGQDYKEYLFFQKLTKQGVDKSSWRVYSLNKAGHIQLVEGPKTTEEKRIKPSNYQDSFTHNMGRSQSYWIIPTYVDAIYMDLEYAQNKWQGDDPQKYSLRSESALLLIRIKKLMQMVRASV